MNAFDLLRPKSLKDALLAVARENPPTVKAAGIDLLDRMKEGLDRPAQLLDILPLAELRGIDEKDGAIRIGALVTLAELASSTLIREKAAALAEAAGTAATPQVRNRATVGGNLFQKTRCWYFRNAEFEPCLMRGGKECFAKDGRNKIHAIFETDAPCVAVDPSSLAPALEALRARYAIAGSADGSGTGWGIVDALRVHGRNTAGASTFKPQTLITHVHVPVVTPRRSAYREFGERESFDWALASAAVSFGWKDGACLEPRIVLGSVSLEVHRCEAAEALLDGKTLTPELAREVAAKALEGAKPLAENGFKVPVARALVARALLAAAGLEEKK
jgi:xanthine dehydrogenase YagS FAD-binding subunit